MQVNITRHIIRPNFGLTSSGVNEEREIYVASTEEMNEFGKKLGLRERDVLIEWNGKPLTLEAFSSTVQQFYETAKEDDKVTVTVRRETKKGKQKVKNLKAKVMLVNSSQKHILDIMENPTQEQSAIRNMWLNSSPN